VGAILAKQEDWRDIRWPRNWTRSKNEEPEEQVSAIKVNIAIEADAIKKDAARGSDITLYINVTYNGQVFPAANWNDYGATMLGLWLVQVENLLLGSDSADLLFLDAGTSLHVQRADDDNIVLTPEKAFGSFSWDTDLSILAVAVVDAASCLRDRLIELGVCDEHVSNLTEGVHRVRNALKSSVSKRR
jgi:hypothetical protein